MRRCCEHSATLFVPPSPKMCPGTRPMVPLLEQHIPSPPKKLVIEFHVVVSLSWPPTLRAAPGGAALSSSLSGKASAADPACGIAQAAVAVAAIARWECARRQCARGRPTGQGAREAHHPTAPWRGGGAWFGCWGPPCRPRGRRRAAPAAARAPPRSPAASVPAASSAPLSLRRRPPPGM